MPVKFRPVNLLIQQLRCVKFQQTKLKRIFLVVGLILSFISTSPIFYGVEIKANFLPSQL